MEVGVSFGWEIVVDDKIDPLDIDTSAEEIGGNQETGSVGLEEVVVLDSFLLLELRVDADGVEELLSEEFCEFLGPVDPVDEDDHLVESQSVKQVGQFLKFLVFVDVDVELGQTVKDEFSLINEDLCFFLQEFLAI